MKNQQPEWIQAAPQMKGDAAPRLKQMRKRRRLGIGPALAVVMATILFGGGPRAHAQGSGPIVFNQSAGAGFGWTHDTDAKDICPQFQALNPVGTCQNAGTTWLGYVNGTLDFTSRRRWKGFGAGIVLGVQWEGARTTSTADSLETETTKTGWEQASGGVNIYLPLPGTGGRLVLVPTAQWMFWLAKVNESGVLFGEAVRAAYYLNGRTMQYGGSLRYRLTRHLYAEGTILHAAIPDSLLEADATGTENPRSLWNYSVGFRYVFRKVQ